ncbi:hypothetical protein KI387_043758, partial [Taxus chinensis]
IHYYKQPGPTRLLVQQLHLLSDLIGDVHELKRQHVQGRSHVLCQLVKLHRHGL